MSRKGYIRIPKRMRQGRENYYLGKTANDIAWEEGRPLKKLKTNKENDK